MKTNSRFSRWTTSLCIASLVISIYPAFSAESVSEKVSDAATEAWDATKQTAKKVGKEVEKKVDELKGEPESVKGNRVDVTLNEYNIQMPASIPAGTTTFVIKNTGKKTHGFEIAGKNFELKKTVEPSETLVITSNLQSGIYEVECPVGKHGEKGMNQIVTVK